LVMAAMEARRGRGESTEKAREKARGASAVCLPAGRCNCNSSTGVCGNW
jgi:hypothetical protein